MGGCGHSWFLGGRSGWAGWEREQVGEGGGADVLGLGSCELARLWCQEPSLGTGVHLLKLRRKVPACEFGTLSPALSSDERWCLGHTHGHMKAACGCWRWPMASFSGTLVSGFHPVAMGRPTCPSLCFCFPLCKKSQSVIRPSRSFISIAH